MATIKQIDGNRRNALKSTGPRTSEGKTAASLNALRHGLRARTVVLPGEDSQEFHHHQEQMDVSQWKLNRMEAGEANRCKETAISKSQVPILDRLWKAEGRMERSYAGS